MKILVTAKRVEDPGLKIQVNSSQSDIERDQMKYVINPFDEIAVEEALRLRDTHGGEVIVVTLGPADAQTQLRTALAMGADSAVHILCENPIDSWLTSLALQKVVEQKQPDVVILGKQAIDDDAGQVGIMLAERLGWSQATFASKEDSLESEAEKSKQAAFKLESNHLIVTREVDGGMETLKLALPALITTELRLNVPRYASLPGIMKAKKKPIEELQVGDLLGDEKPHVSLRKMHPPKSRKAGVMVPDVATLIDKLRNEAKAL